MLMARHPSVLVFAELEPRAQPGGLFALLGHLGVLRALLYTGTRGLAT